MERVDKLTPNEQQLLELLSDGKTRTTSEMAKELKWSKDKVGRVRRSLQEKGVIKKKRIGNVYLYSLIFSSAAVFLATYGIMDYRDKKLRNLILEEQNQRVSADRLLDQKLTTKEKNLVLMLDEIRTEEQLNHLETTRLINNLQNEDSFIRQEMLFRYDLTQADIEALNKKVDFNDLYYNTRFSKGDYERMLLQQGLSKEVIARMKRDAMLSGRLTSAEKRITSAELDIGGLRKNISDLYDNEDEDGGEDEDTPDEGWNREDFIEREYKRIDEGKSPLGRKMPITAEPLTLKEILAKLGG